MSDEKGSDSFNQVVPLKNDEKLEKAKQEFQQLLEKSQWSEDIRARLFKYIETYPKFAYIKNTQGNNLLHLAIINYDSKPIDKGLSARDDKVIELLRNSAITNAVNNNGETALQLAIKYNHERLVTMLLYNKADLPAQYAKDKVASDSKDSVEEVNMSPAIKKALDEYQTNPQIPRVINFVWAGGKKHMSDKDMNVVMDWAKRNPGWKVNIWTDKKTCPEKNILQHYTSEFNNRGIEVTDSKNPDSGQLVVRDISEIGLEPEAESCIRAEIESATPNYGASSDMLRYAILYKYGGAYFDADVPPGSQELDDVIRDVEPNDKHILFVDHCTQDREPSPEKLKKFSRETKDSLGNDTFICTKGNPLMKEFLDAAINNYNVTKFGIPLLERAYGGTNFREMTIGTTGPTLTTKTIDSHEPVPTDENDLVLNNGVVLKRARDGDSVKLVSPDENTTNWLKVLTTRYNSREEALQSIENTIKFEIKHFKVFRFDDHVKNLIDSLQQPNGKITEDQAISEVKKLFVKYVPSMQKYTFMHVQITGKYENTAKMIELCRENRMKTLFNLNIDTFTVALNVASYYDHIQRFEIDRKNKGSIDILVKYSKESKKLYADAINKGLSFIENFMPFVDNFKNKAQDSKDSDLPIHTQVLNLLEERLEEYNQLAKYVNVKSNSNLDLDEASKVNMNKISELKLKVDQAKKNSSGCAIS